jgi:hypothetical protein
MYVGNTYFRQYDADLSAVRMKTDRSTEGPMTSSRAAGMEAATSTSGRLNNVLHYDSNKVTFFQ